MFSKLFKYHFILTNGQELYGRVLAYDDMKVVVSTSDSPDPFKRVVVYHQAIALAEPVANAAAARA